MAISNNRIQKIDEGQVTFRYKDTNGGKTKRCPLPAEEFIRRSLRVQHVLPKGFVKVRYYGLFSTSHRARLHQARALLGADEMNAAPEAEPPAQSPETSLTCPHCGQPLRCGGSRKDCHLVGAGRLEPDLTA